MEEVRIMNNGGSKINWIVPALTKHHIFFMKTNKVFFLLSVPLALSNYSGERTITSSPIVTLAAAAHFKNYDTKTNVGGLFFDERYACNGFNYSYPKTSQVELSRAVVKNGKVSLQFDLAPDAYSGGSVCLLDKVYNIRPYLKKGAVQFWIKGETGREKAWVALVDEEKSDNRKTVVRVDINWFGKISTEWSFISIPLEHFGDEGTYWDAIKQEEVDAPFDWNKVAEFRIESRKGDNATFRVWADDIVIVKSLR
jgi:hypothetical protein